MLFPDWANGKEVLVYKGTSHTLDKDAFVIISEVSDSSVGTNPIVSEVYINGVEILKYYTVKAFPVVASKGDVFKVNSNKNGSISLFVIPLTKQEGGGLKSYYCLLRAQPKVLFFVTGE